MAGRTPTRLIQDGKMAGPLPRRYVDTRRDRLAGPLPRRIFAAPKHVGRYETGTKLAGPLPRRYV
jgi:hypothetical protein